MRSIYQENVETVDMFSQEEKLLAKPLYRKGDPTSSVHSAINSVKFKESHEDKIRNLLRENNGRTSKQLEAISKGSKNELNHSQIDRRVAKMGDVLRGSEIMSDGCCQLFLKVGA